LTKKEREPKLFTVEEANRLLPEVRRFLQELRARQDEVEALEKKKAVEQLSWLESDGSVNPRAQEELSRLEGQQRVAGEAFKKALEGLTGLGAQLKDPQEGLVDFFAARGGERVYLCWKHGEDRIRFWHDLQSGFAGRRPLGEL